MNTPDLHNHSISVGLEGPVVHRCKPGPWGELEYYDTYLEAPDRLIRRLTIPSQQTVWHFEEMTVDLIGQVFEKVGFSTAQIRQAMDGKRWSVSGDLIRIFPTFSLIESLSPSVRGKLYQVLARSELNTMHRYPIQFDGPDLSKVLDRSSLPESLVAQIESLTYREGQVALFSDYPLLLRFLGHPEKERKLLRILTRTRTLIARMILDRKVDLTSLLDYWAPAQDNFDSRPLMESVLRTSGVDTIDIVQLFPPGARSQLFTYPTEDDCLSGRAPDGIWTAINFFNHTALPVYEGTEGLKHHLLNRFRPASAPLRFGDLLLLSPEGESEELPFTHACIYIADDLVYTKNSAQLMAPWILSKLRDVASYHVRGARATIRPYRMASLC
ncbi:MAG: hypothetical protein P1U85_18845 [Verrucomicrobiales bacterium]|nr:hypothetical protein [Verrucomicrobiales bacterium]